MGGWEPTRILSKLRVHVRVELIDPIEEQHLCTMNDDHEKSYTVVT